MKVTQIYIKDPVYTEKELECMCNPPSKRCIHLENLKYMPWKSHCLAIDKMLYGNDRIWRNNMNCPRKLKENELKFAFEVI
jgi:hypothetical protein